MTKPNEKKEDPVAMDAVKQMEKLMFQQPTSNRENGNKHTKKPCRACTDFKSWTKNMTGTKVCLV